MGTMAWGRRAIAVVAGGVMLAGCGGSMGDRKMSGDKMSGDKMMMTGDKAAGGDTMMKDEGMTKDGMSMEKK